MFKKIVEVRCKECDWNTKREVLVSDKQEKVAEQMRGIECEWMPSHIIEWRVTATEDFDALREYTIKEYGYDPGPTPTDEAEAISEDERRQQAESELKEQLRVGFLAANQNATEADFEKLYPQLR